MAHEQVHIKSIYRFRYHLVFIVIGLLILVWSIETPAGIFGKADAIGYAVCHRIDLRSFHIGLRQLPLCARCTGQYVGAMLGLVFQGVVSRKRSGFPPRRVFMIFAVLAGVYAVDGLNSYLSLPPIPEMFPWIPHLYEPSNVLRLLTGTGMGVMLAGIIYPAFVGSTYIEPDPHPAIGDLKTLISLIIVCLLVDLLILGGSPIVLGSIALVSAAGVIILLSLAYTIVILRIYKRENTYARISQISLPLMVGFLVTMSQIALFDAVRFIITRTWNGLSLG